MFDTLSRMEYTLSEITNKNNIMKRKAIIGLDSDKGKYYIPNGKVYFDDLDWFRREYNIPKDVWYDYDGEFGEWLRDCDIRWSQNGLPLVDNNGKWIKRNEPPLIPREIEEMYRIRELLDKKE